MTRLLLFLGFLLTAGMITSQEVANKYFVFLNSNPGRAQLPQAQVDALQQAHRANMDSLAAAGRLIAAGPFHGGGGIFVMVARTKEEVHDLIMTDPAIQAGRFITEVFDLKMNIGGICPVGENYEMAEYHFIRYLPVAEEIEATKESKLKKISNRHAGYLKTSFFKRGLIADADFGDGLGGFLVAFNPGDEEFDTFIKYDPWVKSGLFTLQTRTLWIAKGSFCERENPGNQ
jgi:uncharacterized protein YciI